MKIVPHDYQAKNAAHLAGVLSKYGSAFDGSEPGTGKTVTALETMRLLGQAPVVICPRVVKGAWARTAAAMGVPVTLVENYEAFTRSSRLPDAGVMTETLFRGKVKKQWQWNLTAPLIFDEVHNCKSDKSMNSALLIAAKRQRIPTLMLSATAAESPLDMKALGWHLGLHSFLDYYKWQRRNGCKPGTFGGMEFTGDVKALKRIHDQIYPARAVRVMKSEIPGFPETQILPELYDLGSPSQVDKLYEIMRKATEDLKKVREGDRERALQKAVELAEREGTEVDRELLAMLPDHPLTARLRARQNLEILKVPLFLQLVKEGRANHQHVLVFVNFQRTIDELLERLRKEFEEPISVIQGGQSDKAREGQRQDFQNGVSKIIILNSAAGGVGIDLHDIVGFSPRLSLISPTYRADHMLQVFGRPWRNGALTKSEQRVVLVADSIETGIHDAMMTKIDALSTLNDGDLNNPLR